MIFGKTSVMGQPIPQPDFAFDGETYVFDNRLYFRYLRNGKSVIRKFGRTWAKELQHREIMRQIFEEEVNTRAKILLKSSRSELKNPDTAKCAGKRASYSSCSCKRKTWCI